MTFYLQLDPRLLTPYCAFESLTSFGKARDRHLPYELMIRDLESPVALNPLRN